MWRHIDIRPPMDDHTRDAWIRDLQRREDQLRRLERDADKLAHRLKGGEPNGKRSH